MLIKDEPKFLNKKEQIEIIVKEIKEFNKIINKLLEYDIDLSEKLGGIYDLGQHIISAILGIKIDYSYDSKFEELCDLYYEVITGEITIKQYFKKINKYMSED